MGYDCNAENEELQDNFHLHLVDSLGIAFTSL